MDSSLAYLDPLLFAIVPYMAFFMFFTGTIQRYRQQTFSYSSLSSQFLENERHFWSLVPFHYGILVVIAGHIVAFLFPRELLAFNSKPIRLYILEVTAADSLVQAIKPDQRARLIPLLVVTIKRLSPRQVAEVSHFRANARDRSV